MDYDALQLFLHLSRTLHFRAHEPGVPRQPLGAVARRAAARAGDRLAAPRARSPFGPADRRGGALRRARARHARALAAAASAICAGRARHAHGQHRHLRVGDRLPELPARAALRLPPAPPRHPHPARDRLRRRRARAPGRGARRRQRRGDPARGCRATLVARVLLHTPLVFAAPRAACEVERLCHRRPLPWAELPVVLPASGQARESADRWFRRRRITPARLRRGPRQRGDPRAREPGLRRRHRAPHRARREPAARRRSASSTPTTAARRWASSGSASAPSAGSSPRRSCARSGSRSPAPSAVDSSRGSGHELGRERSLSRAASCASAARASRAGECSHRRGEGACRRGDPNPPS